MLCSSNVPAPTNDTSPRHVLDGDELVVAEHDGHHPTGRRIIDQLLGPHVGRRVAQHQTHLMRHAGGIGGLGHALRLIGGERQRLLTEHVPTAGHRSGQQFRMGVRPGADVDRVASVEHLIHGVAHRVSTGRCEGLGPSGVGVVHAGADHVGAAAFEALRVVCGNEASAQETDAKWRCHDRSVCHVMSAPSTTVRSAMVAASS